MLLAELLLLDFSLTTTCVASLLSILTTTTTTITTVAPRSHRPPLHPLDC